MKSDEPQTTAYTPMKRLLDIAVSSLALALLFPLMAIVSSAVFLRLGNPVLFRQVRPGLYGAPFELLKFRTMRDDVGADGRPLTDAERLTSFGRFLRATSLDELPSFWNVLKGDMSLVGPRPLLIEYLPLYTPDQARRHDIRPGLTGWAQVNGRNALSWEQKFALDLWYIEHRSIWLDVWILFMTFYKVVRRDGISSKGSVTADKFEGSPRSTVPDSFNK